MTTRAMAYDLLWRLSTKAVFQNKLRRTSNKQPANSGHLKMADKLRIYELYYHCINTVSANKQQFITVSYN